RPAPPIRARRTGLPALALALAMLVAGCVPAAVAEAIDTPAAQAVARAAEETFHRMELGRLATGVYTTNVLVDVDLPRGARITVEAFANDDYRLRVEGDQVAGVAWLVTPRGVRRVLVN
ncbi:MAG: hypothetical protein P1P87_13190, partial [Trueperaceae bacterium]|nr:hypothetical protein [Trueperaceae bacterium]